MSLPDIPDLNEIGWGYPKELLGTRSRTSVTIRPIQSVEQSVKIDFRRRHTRASEDVLYEIALRKEDAPATYSMPEELEGLVRHLQGWVETNSAAMLKSKGFWMEYLDTQYRMASKANPKVFSAIVRLRFHSVRGTS